MSVLFLSTACSETWYYKTVYKLLRWAKVVEHVTKVASRKDVLVLLALACPVLIAGVAVLIHGFLTGRFPVTRNTISEIISNPTAWENRTVKVEGTIRRTTLGIVRPFNYWLSDRENQTMCIGVKWHSEADLTGKNVRVIGVVRKGYSWVHPDHPGWWVYFIEASSVYETP